MSPATSFRGSCWTGLFFWSSGNTKICPKSFKLQWATLVRAIMTSHLPTVKDAVKIPFFSHSFCWCYYLLQFKKEESGSFCTAVQIFALVTPLPPSPFSQISSCLPYWPSSASFKKDPSVLANPLKGGGGKKATTTLAILLIPSLEPHNKTTIKKFPPSHPWPPLPFPRSRPQEHPSSSFLIFFAEVGGIEGSVIQASPRY